MADKVLVKNRNRLRDGLTETDIKRLVDDLQHKKVIQQEEAESILHPTKERADRARQLIDSVAKKGKEASRIMLTSLKDDNNSLYKQLEIDDSAEMSSAGAAPTGQPAPGSHNYCTKAALQRNKRSVKKREINPALSKPKAVARNQNSKRCLDDPKTTVGKKAKTDEYEMNSIPRGFCVIINNENFINPKQERLGSSYDANSLEGLFVFLGFTVKIHKDLKADEIRDLMAAYSKDSRHGDCFVCCVLSHGNEAGVLGQDEKICSQNDITSPFNGVNCPILAGKPKVFFIQACRGREMQSKVTLHTDDPGSSDRKSGNVSYTIAKDSDFLIAMSTVQGYYSIRNSQKGSWFIQTLCKHLEEGSKQGHDILKILTDVNSDVSKKEGYITINGKKIDGKMTPAPYFTLTKTLIFRVPEGHQ